MFEKRPIINEMSQQNIEDAKLHSEHKLNDQGNPAGGRTTGKGFQIDWQNGPLVGPDGQRQEPNGAFVENVIAAAIDRISFYQGTKFRCEENEAAIGYLNAAMDSLHVRTRQRQSRGVEGKHEV
jgi:hypothetical protein